MYDRITTYVITSTSNHYSISICYRHLFVNVDTYRRIRRLKALSSSESVCKKLDKNYGFMITYVGSEAASKVKFQAVSTYRVERDMLCYVCDCKNRRQTVHRP